MTSTKTFLITIFHANSTVVCVTRSTKFQLKKDVCFEKKSMTGFILLKQRVVYIIIEGVDLFKFLVGF